MELERKYKQSKRKRIARFDCHGRLVVHVDVPAMEATVRLQHDALHLKPEDPATPDEVKKEIQANLHLDPVQIRNELRKKFDISKVTAKQIHYWWSFFTQRFYKMNDDHIISAQTFLTANRAADCDLCFELTTNQVTAIGFTTPLLSAIAYVSEVHCDATYKTSKGRFELYGLVGDIEGSGFPLAYLVLDTTRTQEDDSQDRLRTVALVGFFRAVCDRGLHPHYFYTDKDFAEINAAKEIWPEADIQLCQWHVERAIKEKLRSRKKIQRTQYLPLEAAMEFDFIDINFTPDLGRAESEYYQICPPNLRERIIDIVRKHFNMHQKIPINASGQLLTPAEIRTKSVHEMYSYCVENGLVLLWSYFWSSWYKRARWCLWARSTRATIPIGKTNMMIEAHWKVLKHGYLYRFNRPRLDYLVWVVCCRVLPDQTARLRQLCLGRVTPSWFDDFKKEWKRLAEKPTTADDDERHAIDLDRWVCSCPSFLRSRFLICKHLIQRAITKALLSNPKGIRLVYANFRRRTDYPFLIWDGSQPQDVPLNTNFEPQMQPDIGFVPDGDGESVEPEFRQQCELNVAMLGRLVEHLKEELAANNLRHVGNVISGVERALTIIDDIESTKRKLRREVTWRGSKPWTMFLQ